MKALQYIPYRSKNDTLIQARIPKEMHKEVKKFMEERKLNWNDIIVACMRSLLDEVNEAQKTEL